VRVKKQANEKSGVLSKRVTRDTDVKVVYLPNRQDRIKRSRRRKPYEFLIHPAAFWRGTDKGLVKNLMAKDECTRRYKAIEHILANAEYRAGTEKMLDELLQAMALWVTHDPGQFQVRRNRALPERLLVQLRIAAKEVGRYRWTFLHKYIRRLAEFARGSVGLRLWLNTHEPKDRQRAVA
jgi:hypothetical protein